MFVKTIVCLISLVSASASSPVERLRYVCEKMAHLLPARAECRTEQITPEDHQFIIDAMVQFVQSNESALDNFVSVLSGALRCGITAAELDSYKWEVLSALLDQSSETKKRGKSAAAEEQVDYSNKKSRHIEEVVDKEEVQTTTLEPILAPNLSLRETDSLVKEIEYYMRRCNPEDRGLKRWGSLRVHEGYRAAKKDYAAIREDLDILVSLRASSRDIANIFALAHSVMIHGELSPVDPPRTPPFDEKEIQKPLLERLESFYSNRAYRWSRNDRSSLSLKLAENIEAGRVDYVANALNLAVAVDTPRWEVSNTFYQAYKALGGKY